MTRSTLRRATAATVTVLALASLAACGDDDADPSSSEAGSSDGPSDGSEGAETDDPGDAPEDAGADDAGEEIEASEFVDVFRTAMDGATSATFEMAIGGSGGPMGKGAADFSTSPPTMQLVFSDPASGQDQTILLVDGVLYLGMGPKQFVEYDLTDPNSPVGAELVEQFDPTSMADTFQEGITSAAYLGEEDVDGEPMEHYRVTLDATSLVDEADLPGGTPSEASEDVTFDLWFDGEGMLRRQTAGFGATGGGVEQSFDNWGEPVDIQAPPKSQITQLPGR